MSIKNKLPDFWENYALSFNQGVSQNLAETTFVALDTETTGFDFRKDRILSIGALQLQNGIISVKTAFEVFLKQETFDANSVAIHGILKRSKHAQIPEIEALEILLKTLKGAVIIAHHTGFDVGMINQALKRNGLPKLLNPVLDTAVLFPKILPKRKRQGNYSLDALAEHYNIPKTDRHTALGDAYITAIAFLHISGKLKPASLDDLFKKDRFWEFWK